MNRKKKYRISFIAVLLLLCASNITHGQNYPDIGVSVAGINTDWTNPSNIVANDNSYTTCTLSASSLSDTLKITDFDFAIPSGSSIDGITVEIGRYSSGTTPQIRDNDLFLINGQKQVVGVNKALTTTNWPTSEANQTYGGATDTWNAFLTVADVNDIDFGVAIVVRNANVSNVRTAYIDYVRITINYTVPCSGTPSPGNTIASIDPVANGVPFTLSLQNTTAGAGVTYQWQSGLSSTGPWSNIAGANGSTLTTTQYSTTWYRCIVTCSATGNSGTSNPIEVNSSGNTYLMSSTNITNCSGTIYDSGGGSVDYLNNEHYIMYISPSTPGAMIQLSFTSFNTQSGKDYLHILDGPSVSSPIIGSYSGTTSPGTITATNQYGVITLVFDSDNFNTKPGWEANFSCVVPNDNCANATPLGVNSSCNLTPSSLSGATYSAGSYCTTNEDVWFSFFAGADIHNILVNEGSDMDVVLELFSGSCGSLTSLGCDHTSGTGSSELLTNASLTAGQEYYIRVSNYAATDPTDASFEICVYGEGSTVYYAGTEGLQNTYVTHCMQNIDCGETSYFYDDGGPSGNYYDDPTNYAGAFYRTFCPDALGKCVRATITSMDIICDPYDYLDVRNGPTQGSTILWRGCGTIASPVTDIGTWSTIYTANNESGCLSFGFKSFGGSVGAGWNISLTGVDCAIAAPDTFNDCEHAIPTCGSMSFEGYSNGPGLTSDCGGCVVAENYVTWYYFETVTSGTLSFTINTTNDYDFALYQSSSCDQLGTPVRCSYSGATGNTGLASGATDYSEDVNGDGFVAPVNVIGGETYILMVNSWSASNPAYTMSFSFSGSFANCTEISLPVELLSFTGECKNNHSELIWQTASETNCDYFAIMKSTDNTVWKTAGYVIATGNSNTPRSYFFTDPEENDGSVYYKLKTVDFDGSSEYGPLLAVTCGEKENLFEVSILYNNEEGFTTVNFTCVEGDDYTVTLMSMNGQLVFRQTLEAASNMVSVDIPTAALNSGVYSLSITSAKSVYGTKVFIH